jgi:hypothetical protein
MNADPVDPDVQRGYDRAAYGVTKDDLEDKGERAVRDALNSGAYGSSSHKNHTFVSAWLADKDFERTTTEAIKRDTREERTLAIAEDALSIAKDANRIASEDLALATSSAASARDQARWAKWAAIIATVAAIIGTKDQFVALIISWLP